MIPDQGFYTVYSLVPSLDVSQINEVIQHLFFFLWFKSNVAPAPFNCIHIAVNYKISPSYNNIVYMCHSFFIHSSAVKHLGGFPILAIVLRTVVKTGVHTSFQINVFVWEEGL